MEPAVGVIYGSPRGVWCSKAAFRALGSAFSISIVGLTGAWLAAVAQDPNYPLTVDLHQGIFYEIQAGLSFLYNTIELACILLGAGHRGMHPGASIVADLILTINLIMAILLPVLVCRGDWCTWEGTRRDFSPHMGPWWTGGPTFWFSVFLAFFHLVLFTFACWEAAVRVRRAVRVVISTADDESVAVASRHQGYRDEVSREKVAAWESYRAAGVEKN